MEVELTEEEQKIYDNLVKYTSGEYRDTEYDIGYSSGVFYKEDIYLTVEKWEHAKGAKEIEICLNGKSRRRAKLVNWRELVKEDFYRDFIDRYSRKLILSMPDIDEEDIKLAPEIAEIKRKTSGWGSNYRIKSNSAPGLKVEKVTVYFDKVFTVYFDKVFSVIKNKRDLRKRNKNLGQIHCYLEVKIPVNNEKVIVELSVYKYDEGSDLGTEGYRIFTWKESKGKKLKMEGFDRALSMNFNAFKSYLNGVGGIIPGKAWDLFSKEWGEVLEELFFGMLKYGSPENYLKQVIASRKAV
jgi:hypothetical protein